MLRKAKSRVKRIGLKSYKAIFSIRVLKVTIPQEVCIYEASKPCQLSVSFERGGKMASTTGQDVNIKDSLAVATFDEKLTLGYPPSPTTHTTVFITHASSYYTTYSFSGYLVRK